MRHSAGTPKAESVRLCPLLSGYGHTSCGRLTPKACGGCRERTPGVRAAEPRLLSASESSFEQGLGFSRAQAMGAEGEDFLPGLGL